MGFLDKLTKARKKPELEKTKSQVKVDKEEGEKTLRQAQGKEKEEIKKTAPAEKVKKNIVNSNAHNVLRHPLVSEKAAVAETNNVYTFVVNRKASKDAVRQAIKDVYGVSPTRVRMINMEGKKARHGRSLGRRGDWRKAMITLPAGRAISVHEGV